MEVLPSSISILLNRCYLKFLEGVGVSLSGLIYTARTSRLLVDQPRSRSSLLIDLVHVHVSLLMAGGKQTGSGPCARTRGSVGIPPFVYQVCQGQNHTLMLNGRRQMFSGAEASTVNSTRLTATVKQLGSAYAYYSVYLIEDEVIKGTEVCSSF